MELRSVVAADGRHMNRFITSRAVVHFRQASISNAALPRMEPSREALNRIRIRKYVRVFPTRRFFCSIVVPHVENATRAPTYL